MRGEVHMLNLRYRDRHRIIAIAVAKHHYSRPDPLAELSADIVKQGLFP